MPQFWPGLTPEIDQFRHGKTSNYLFLDWHVQILKFEKTYDVANNVNKWNPLIAR